MNHSRTRFESRDLRYILRFAVVGTLGTFIDIGLFAGLHALLSVPTLAANTISYSAGIVNNFVLHRHWTWSHQARKAIGAQFSQFALVSLAALMLNNLLVLLLAPPFGTLFAHVGYGILLAKICATGVGLGWNFLVNHFWTFRDAPLEV